MGGGTFCLECAQTSQTIGKPVLQVAIFSSHTTPQTKTRDNYIDIVVFDLEDDNTNGTLATHPYVEGTDENTL